MNKTTQLEENLASRAQLFKALGHPARLLIINLIQTKPRHGEELAAILNLNPATVSHHLAHLTRVGLLTARKDQYYQMYSLSGDILEKKLAELVHLPQPGLKTAVSADAYRDKVLRTFFKNGRLTQFPAQLKKRQIVLAYMTQDFEPDKEYSEREVNHILLEYHEDFATIRREMVEEGLMTRKNGIYRRVAQPE